jgi:hypothetical protein
VPIKTHLFTAWVLDGPPTIHPEFRILVRQCFFGRFSANALLFDLTATCISYYVTLGLEANSLAGTAKDLFA